MTNLLRKALMENRKKLMLVGILMSMLFLSGCVPIVLPAAMFTGISLVVVAILTGIPITGATIFMFTYGKLIAVLLTLILAFFLLKKLIN